MAVAISNTIVRTSRPPVQMSVEYDYWRDGNSMKYNLYIKANCTTSSAWDNQRWGINVSFNNKEIRNFRNDTLKPATSGTIGTREYTYTITGLSVDINAGSIPISVQGVRTYNYPPYNQYGDTWKVLTGNLSVITPSAPNAPANIYIPSSAAPDDTVTISWSTASGGTNGVTGYYLAYSNTGGSSWSYVYVSETSYALNLDDAGFKQGSRLKCAILAYSTVNGTMYTSSWTYSSTITTSFVAPSVPRSLVLTCLSDEPIPTAQFRGSWTAPSSGGSNGVSGYQIQWLKNGVNYGSAITTDSTNRTITLNGTDYTPNDRISFKVRAYTIGQETNYYSSYATSQYIIIVSDKFIYVSIDGGSFEKYKMYYSSNGGNFIEIKKEKFKTI